MSRRTLLGSLSLLVALAAPAGSAWATTAANTQIVNTATLTFNGGSKNASVTVAVNLVAAQPTVVLNGNLGGYTGVNTPVLADSLILTSNANGPALYHITAAIGSGAQATTNATGASVTDGGSGIDVTLGASVTTVGASSTSGGNTLVIPVPDAAHVTGSGATLAVNGIGIGSSITFATFTRNVTAITLNADNTYTITFNGAAITPVAAGTPVYEQKTVSGITALPGTVTTLGTDIHVFAQATVTTSGAALTTSNWADNKWTSALPTVALTKYVRNLTTSGSNPGGGTTFTVNGVSSAYFTSGVTGKQDDVLEYVLFASNTSTTSDLTGTALSDALPTSYVDVVTGAYGGGGADVFYSPSGNGTGSALAIGAAATNQAYTTVTSASTTTLTVNVGTGAGVNTLGTIGKEVAGNPTNVFIAYRVKIK